MLGDKQCNRCAFPRISFRDTLLMTLSRIATYRHTQAHQAREYLKHGLSNANQQSQLILPLLLLGRYLHRRR